MFPQDPFKDCGSAGMIPDPVGVHDGDGSVGAYPQACGLGSVHPHLRPGEIQFPETAFQEVPGLEAFLPGAALRLRGVDAEEDMAGPGADAE